MLSLRTITGARRHPVEVVRLGAIAPTVQFIVKPKRTRIVDKPLTIAQKTGMRSGDGKLYMIWERYSTFIATTPP